MTGSQQPQRQVIAYKTGRAGHKHMHAASFACPRQEYGRCVPKARAGFSSGQDESRSAATPLRGWLLPKAVGAAIYKTEAGIDVG
ncbi:hypothetical protein AGMMS49974_05690 [Deltaproteobacteria bacterium]|nr:hypothetical protein AGMMS49974_05690 [Deltaproteobacteria bacterium]